MNLLFVCPSYYPYRGGAEFLMSDMGRLLAARGHDVTILTGTSAPATAAPQGHQLRVIRLRFPGGERAVRWRLSTLWRDGVVMWQHFRILRRLRIETVCIGCFNKSAIYVLLVALFVRFRLVMYLHGSETRVSSAQSWWFRRIFLYAMRRCNAIVAVSEDLRKEAVALQPSIWQKVVVIPNGIDVRAVQRQAAAGPPGTFLLFAGRLEPVKNLAFLVRAFAKASPVIPAVRLVIAGTGSLDAELKALAQTLDMEDRVYFTGALERETVYGYLKNAACIVHPSLSEGHPIILLEALAAGQWVLASDVTGNRDVIEPGRNGFLFRPDDEDQLVRLMVDVVSRGNQGTSREHSGQERDLDRVDLEKLLDRHLQVFEGAN